MDKELRFVERLYDGDQEPRGNEPRSREERSLAEAKFLMDHRQKHRPDAATIDRIVALAASHGGGATAESTAPRARIIPMFRWSAAVAAVFALFVVGITYWKLDSSVVNPSTAVAEQEPAGSGAALSSKEEPIPAEERAEGQATGRQRLTLDEVAAARAASPFAELLDDDARSALVAAGNDSIPSWDDSADLRLLQKRIEMLRRSGADLEWGAPAVPLESMPAAATQPGIRAAGAGNN